MMTLPKMIDTLGCVQPPESQGLPSTSVDQAPSRHHTISKIIKASTIVRQNSFPTAFIGPTGVYKCMWNRDAGSDEVALYFPTFGSVAESEVARINKRLDREIYIWAVLEHQYILPFYGTVEGFGPFRALVSPWMPNGNLNSYLSHTDVTLTAMNRLRILKQITEGLKYLHDNDVIHGDLTSNNVLIAADGSPRLAGFGISNIIKQSNPVFSYHTGAVRWVAPEFIIAPEEQTIQYETKSGDMYALGGIMLQVLYGKQPYWWIKAALHVLSAKFNHVEPINSSIQFYPNHLDFMRRCWSAKGEVRPSVDDAVKFLQKLLVEAPLAPRFQQQSRGARWVPFAQAESDSYSTVTPEVMLQDLTKHITRVEEYPMAHGGFGDVWKCIYHTDRGPTDVAVKSLHVYTSDADESMEQKFRRIRRELKICATVKHPNILSVYGCTSGFGPFMAIVSPWAENGDLVTYLKNQGASLPLVRRFQILRDIAAGLKYLHSHNIIHGDLTGPNVLIHGDGTACLADFGLSLLYSEVVSISQASWTSSFHGNLRWLAPELLGEPDNDILVRPNTCSDIYSFGGIMLCVLTSQIPYYYLRNTAVFGCVYARKKPDRSHYLAFSDKYWYFIEECWSADPCDRPSAKRVVEVIRDELDSLSISSVDP